MTQRAMTPQDEERTAIERARSGSVEAFEPLVSLYGSRIIRLAYHFLGDWEEARDLAQETFARAYLCLNRYDPGRPFGAWIFTIAARLATDRLRNRRMRARAGESLRLLASEAPAPFDTLSALSLKEALGRLTPRQRQAVVLCDLHGFTATEAASMIACTASTVRVLRFLARRRLRELLGAESPTGESDVEAVTAEVNE
ncbi:MAG TPA: sigma-70 family RNA polymerase sigma factor [Patescibacteria group bacterium]|jgi:RNA polymerase sigma-70 factor (ECF subfamily)|nr:sigma-70 family RNA polymerase sigma factor [Patescibacteria group bacterium]